MVDAKSSETRVFFSWRDGLMIDWSLIIDESGLTGERTGSCGLEMLFVKHDCVCTVNT